MIEQQAFCKLLAEHVQAQADKIVAEEAAAAAKRVEERVKMTCALAAVKVLENMDFMRMGQAITIKVNAEEFVRALKTRTGT